MSVKGPADPTAALAHLIARHTENDLFESGLIRRTSLGKSVLHEGLAQGGANIVVLRDSLSGNITDLMTECGCVRANVPAAFEILGDKHTFDVLSGNQRAILVTETITDTILFRSLGLAAAPVAGLAGIGDRGIELLQEFYGVTRRKSPREQDEKDDSEAEGSGGLEELSSLRLHSNDERCSKQSAAAPPRMPSYIVPTSYVGTEHGDHVSLVFVEWSPQQVSGSKQPAIRRAIDSLNQLKVFRGVDTFELLSWVPSDHALDAIRFGLSKGNPNWVKDAVLDSLHGNVGSIDSSGKAIAPAPPTDVATAIEELYEIMLAQGTDAYSRKRHQEALRTYHRLSVQQVMSPILRAAQAMNDPSERAIHIQFAHLNALFLEQMPLVRQNLLNDAATMNEEQRAASSKKLSDLLAVSNQLVALAKEVAKCKPRSRRASPKAAPKLNVDLSRRFKDSDLVSKN